MVKARTIVALGLVAGGLYFLVTKAKAACTMLDRTMEYYYLTYKGPAQTFKKALGECYDAVYTIDVWDEVYYQYLSPVDPVNEIIKPNTECRVMVQEPCRLCGFYPSTPVM